MSINKLKRLKNLKRREGVSFEPNEVNTKDLYDSFTDQELGRSLSELCKQPQPRRTVFQSLSEQYNRKSRPATYPPLAVEPPVERKPARKKPAVKKPISSGLQEYFKSQINIIYGQEVITKRWGVKENTLAKKLCQNYTREMVEIVIKNFVEEWPSMVTSSRGRLSGLPTINFLWSCQDRFFGAQQVVQPTIKPSREDEYREVEDTDLDW